MDDTLAALDQGMQELAAAAARQTNNSMIIHFSLDPMENPAKTRSSGRPVFDDVEMIEIRAPGEKDFVRRPVRDSDKMEYAKQYMAWKLNQDQTTSAGMPLAQWPQMKRSQVEEAKFMAIHTVEQLSGVSDSNLQKLGPGWMPLRQSARDWLKNAKDGAAVAALRAENDDMKARLATLEQMLARQAAELQGKALESGVPAVASVGLTPEQIQAMIAAAVKAAVPAAPAPPPRKKPGPKSKAEKAALAAANGEQK